MLRRKTGNSTTCMIPYAVSQAGTEHLSTGWGLPSAVLRLPSAMLCGQLHLPQVYGIQYGVSQQYARAVQALWGCLMRVHSAKCCQWYEAAVLCQTAVLVAVGPFGTKIGALMFVLRVQNNSAMQNSLASSCKLSKSDMKLPAWQPNSSTTKTRAGIFWSSIA